MRVTIFDLDGTITWQDTFAGFLIGYVRRRPARWIRAWRLPGVLLWFVLTGRDRGYLKQRVMQIFMRGDARRDIDAWASEFAARVVQGRCRPAALRALDDHRRSGDYLVLLSASPDLYVPLIGALLGMNRTICTGVSFDGDRLNGTLSTPNRRGEEKARCLESLRAEFPGSPMTAYGNSDSDLPHMRRADHALLVNASSAARRAARALNIDCGDWT